MVGPGAAGRGPAQQAVAAALERAAAVAHLNAFITLDAEGAGAEAARHDRRGGATRRWCLAVKDSIHVAGLPNTAGTPGLAGFVPAADAPVVAALRAAGAIVLGKTNMHELALGVTSGNPTFGAVGNGADPALFAGGSSGGSAAAVASGIVDAGLGTDTGGSVGIPAALNGIYGLRPSAGRYPSAGVTPLSVTRDTPGPMARTLDRLAALDAFVASTAPGRRRPRTARSGSACRGMCSPRTWRPRSGRPGRRPWTGSARRGPSGCRWTPGTWSSTTPGPGCTSCSGSSPPPSTATSPGTASGAAPPRWWRRPPTRPSRSC